MVSKVENNKGTVLQNLSLARVLIISGQIPPETPLWQATCLVQELRQNGLLVINNGRISISDRQPNDSEKNEDH